MIKPQIILWEDISYCGIAPELGIQAFRKELSENKRIPKYLQKKVIVFIRGDYSFVDFRQVGVLPLWLSKSISENLPFLEPFFTRLEKKMDASAQKHGDAPAYEPNVMPEEIIWVRYSEKLYGELLRLYEEKSKKASADNGISVGEDVSD